MSTKNLFFIFLLMLAIFLGTIWMIVYNDIGGTQKYVKNIPLIEKLLPASNDMENIEEELNSYSYSKLIKYTLSLYKNNESNKKKLKEAETELSRWGGEDGNVIRGKYSELESELKKNMDEVIRLREFEDAYVKLKRQKLEADRIVALNDKKQYKAYYETISPEDAAEIYKNVLEDDMLDAEVTKFVTSFGNMDAKKAALVLEELARTDFDVVLAVVKKLDSQVASDILGNMETAYASMITKGIAGKIIK